MDIGDDHDVVWIPAKAVGRDGAEPVEGDGRAGGDDEDEVEDGETGHDGDDGVDGVDMRGVLVDAQQCDAEGDLHDPGREAVDDLADEEQLFTCLVFESSF